MGWRDRTRRLHVWFIAGFLPSFLWVSLDFICVLRCLESFAPNLLGNLYNASILQKFATPCGKRSFELKDASSCTNYHLEFDPKNNSYVSVLMEL